MKIITDYFNKTRTVLEELEPDILILDNLISSTEEEFLTIGEKLQKFHQQAREISDLSADVASRISGEEMKPVIEGFNTVSEMVEEIGDSFDAKKAMLSSILLNLARIRTPLTGFEKVVRNLSIIGTFIKIEIAKLGKSDTSFNTLSEDVRRIAALVDAKTASLIDKTDIIFPALKQNISLIENYKSQQEGQSRLVMNKISKNLEIISQRKDIAAQTILDVSGKWRQITASIGEIVQSIQFHDITRQRIEHISEALKKLKQKTADVKKERTVLRRVYQSLKAGRHNSNGNGSYIFPVANLIADTCKLQYAQLQNANEDFVAAIEHILKNLDDVALYAGSISEEIMQISGRTESNAGSFIVEMERDVDYLSSSIGAFARIKQDLSEAMNTMTRTAADMSGYMKEMEKISIEMQILALNASIHSAHIGDQGKSLSTLADSIHRLAAQTITMVTEIVTNLQEAVFNAEKLVVMANQESSDSNRKTAQIKNSLDEMLLPLKTMEKEIEALLPRIDRSGKSLTLDIRALISEINIHHAVSSSIEAVEVSLEKAVRKMKVREVAGDKPRLLEDLASRYTMNSEREMHLVAAGIIPEQLPAGHDVTDPEVVPDKAKTEAGKDDDGLGDNVELF